MWMASRRWPGSGRSRHDGVMSHVRVVQAPRRPVDRALRVGLTGGIGAGKSTVAALLEAHGAVVTSADEISRDVVSPGSDGLAAVVAEFGDDVLTPAGTLDRRALGNLVFANDLSRARLEEILLPLIAAEDLLQARTAQVVEEILLPLIAAEAWARMEAVPAGRVAVYDVPLLVEGQMQDLFDLVVVVEADLELRLERLAERGMEREKALARIASQATDDERRAVADIVLSNSGSIDQLSADVDRLWSTRIMVAGTNV